jgi:hypothetical protein
MIIELAHEAYSAKDQIRKRNLVQSWNEMKLDFGYCRLITITTSTPQEIFNYGSRIGAEWPFLSDPQWLVERDLDIAECTDPGHDQTVLHTIVCEPGPIVYKIYNGHWLFGNLTNEELRHDLRAMLLERHGDWDLSRADVREAWERGERERFYPQEPGWVGES